MGGHTTWLSSPKDKKQAIEQVYQQLTEVNSLTQTERQVAGEQVSKAVEKALVMHLSYPRL